MIDPPLVSTRPHFMVTLYECIVFMHTFDMLYKSISICILYTFYMGAHLKKNHCCPLLNKMYSNVGNIPVLNVHIS